MHTLSVFVASLITVGVNNGPQNHAQPYAFYPANQASAVMLASVVEPLTQNDLDLRIDWNGPPEPGIVRDSFRYEKFSRVAIALRSKHPVRRDA